ncbi:MAG TPA: amino acid adenylation domain-containing protein [Kofleriaceae bacterium]|nr:amino acid adenylation domain-containing protein [Kofleriaceae bacterium]
MPCNQTAGAFPLNDLQLAYWIGRRNVLEWGNVPTHFYFELDGQVEPARLERAMRQTIAGHGMLRARFLDSAEQLILESAPPFDLRVDDLTGLTLADVESHLAATRERMSHSSPLRDDSSPPYELVVSRMREGRTRLHLNLDMLVFDMVSMRLFLGALGGAYEGRAAAPAAGDFDFRAYLELERAAESAEHVRTSMRYWSERCLDLPPAPVLPAPLTQDAQAIHSPRMTARRHRLPAGRWAALRRRAAEHGLTPSCVLGAAYAEVLARWSASPRMTLNLTQVRRSEHHPSVGGMIGEFTNTILLGVDWAQGATFVERASSFAERLWTDIAHSDVSGIRVQREMARAAGQPVVMPVVFTCALDDMQEPARWAGDLVHMVCETSQVCLDNMVIGVGDSPVVLWNSVDQYFAPGVVEDMFGAYCELLGRLADDRAAWSERRAVRLPRRMRAARERANATSASDEGALLHTLARAHLRERSDRPAIIAGGATITYGELFGAAAALGGELRRRRPARDSLVAIVMQKGWEQVVSALAIHEAGAAYLPIDPCWPTDRVRWLLENARASIVLTQPDVDARMTWPASVERIVVDAGVLEGARGREPLAPLQRPSDLAYVIYTSGSTGQPKGVMIEHRSAANTVLDMNRRFAVGPDDRVLALSNMSFDLSVYDVFGLLAAGGAIVMPEPGALRDPGTWAELIRRHGVTIWNSVPQLMQMLVDFHPGRQLVAECPSLRVALLSGDWIPLALPRSLEGIDAISLGGATEASIWSIYHPIGRIDPAWRSVPYGVPLANQTWSVLDESLDDQPDWVAGDLYIGGVGLARGYWGDVDRTRTSFIVHPSTGERLYRTGDLGRYMGDATIEFLGRQDAQVKVQGYRVELGEIEHCARSHAEVEECCVVVREVGAGERAAEQRRGVEHRFLLAYVVTRPGAQPTEPDIRAHLRAKLPEYMVPARIVMLDRLPLSSNGKVDRAALPEVNGEDSSASALAEEATATERDVTALWSALLGRPAEQIPRRMNFFDLGGNSLLLVALSNALRDQLGHVVPLAQLFQKTTVHALAAHLDEQASSATAESPPAERDRRAVALERQRRMRARGREPRDDS